MCIQKCVDRKSIKFQRSVLVNTPLSINTINETLKALLPVCMKLQLLLRGRSRVGAKPSGLSLKQGVWGCRDPEAHKFSVGVSEQWDIADIPFVIH